MTSPAPNIDLAAYAARLGLAELPPPTPAGIGELILAHTRAIPFESLDAFLGRGVDLGLEAVARKLLLEKRGGWCFEQNLLFGEVLRALGLRVTDLAARVLWFRPPGSRAPRTHRLLLLELAGQRYLADVGFGVLTLTGLLRLEPEVIQATPHEPHRLLREDNDWVLEAQLAGMWQPVYGFDLHPHWPEDFEPVNFQLAHDPASLFVSQVRAARVTNAGRLSLRGTELSLWGKTGLVEQRQLGSPAEMLDVLERDFGIAARALPGIEQGLARSFATSP
jgi:N-hydroxyarylamine O-acetyltransferase